ncbi:MAG: pyruvate, phosphate dikinase, partial [Planctomycetota bacterium]
MGHSKMVYSFGEGKADGKAGMKNLLGGKGANLAEMCRMGIAVPPGFTITTEVCAHCLRSNGRWPAGLAQQVAEAMAGIERIMGRRFGDPRDPLLVSVRSGARQSMPGMMETVLNIGLTTGTIDGLIDKTGDPRFAHDAYRRLITMYSDVVMEKAAGIEPQEERGIRKQLEELLARKKAQRGVRLDTKLSAADLQELCGAYKRRIEEVLGQTFPDDPRQQLRGAINAVFRSWMGKRAVEYRRIEKLSGDWQTAVNVQAMVFGNLGETSATGVACTRDPDTGATLLYGDWLPNAQGEDVVAGTRETFPLSNRGKTAQQKAQGIRSLQEAMPKAYRELHAICSTLERHYRDMQDVEFTIEQGRLWMLQTRAAKRNGAAAVRIAMAMLKEELISADEALMLVRPSKLEELLHPMIDPASEAGREPIATGLPAGPGGACGVLVFSPDRAEAMAKQGKKVVLTRVETNAEDVAGMYAAAAILTTSGGRTSHAALVVRGWGKCCIVGCSALVIDYANRRMTVDGKTYAEGDWVTLNGTTGNVYEGKLGLIDADPGGNRYYLRLMKLADQRRVLRVRANADKGDEADAARALGAQGIGLVRTEHMFFDPERIRAMQELILAVSAEARRTAVMKLLPYQRDDFIRIFTAMKGLPVTIRLLDPPLHEFVPTAPEQLQKLAQTAGVSEIQLKARVDQLHETNPMLGHRGCRLGVSCPEITEMQSRAIFEAVVELRKRRVKAIPEVMIPLVGHINEFNDQARIIHRVAAEVMKETRTKFKYLVGTMIEVPRAALTAHMIATGAQFFSFGTNDL